MPFPISNCRLRIGDPVGNRKSAIVNCPGRKHLQNPDVNRGHEPCCIPLNRPPNIPSAKGKHAHSRRRQPTGQDRQIHRGPVGAGQPAGLKGQGGRPVGPRRDGLKGLHNLSPGQRPGNMAKEHPQAESLEHQVCFRREGASQPASHLLERCWLRCTGLVQGLQPWKSI